MRKLAAVPLSLTCFRMISPSSSSAFRMKGLNAARKMGENSCKSGSRSGILLMIYILSSSSSFLLVETGASSGSPHGGTGTGEIESCSLQTSAQFSQAGVVSTTSRRLQVNNNVESSSGPVLICQIRTLHSDLNLTSLLSVPSRNRMMMSQQQQQQSPEGVVKLKLICNDLLFFESVLQSGQLRPFSGLQELEIDRCKLKIIRAKSFQGLSRLRKLSIRTGNAEWPARSLEISAGAFQLGSYSSLEDLHLGYNNIRTLPGDFLCQVGNLQTINLTHNLLSNINDLGLMQTSEDASGGGSSSSSSGEIEMETTTMSVSVGGGAPAPSAPCGSVLKSLDLSFNAIQSLGKFILPNLQSLRLDHNRVEELQPGAFNSLHQLRSLHLSSNLLYSLPSDAFSTTRHLRELYLQNNSLSELLPGLFSKLDHLHTLDLSHNQLSNNFMSAQTFENLARLVILNLSGNQLSHVSLTMFSDLRALQLLDLSDNLITRIEDLSFTSLKNLHALNLAQNRLTVVNAHTFTGLPVLHRLLLDYNSITSVHPDAFTANGNGTTSRGSSLQDISFVRNQLESVPEALRNLPIRTLDLGENRIQALHADSLLGLSQLYGLRLAGNELEQIGKKFCQFTPRLRALNLAQNKISKIELTAFNGCPQLKVLRLDSNNLTALSPSFSSELQSLLWLNVSMNRLEFVDYTSLPQKLEWLDFSYNDVHTLWGGSAASNGLLNHLRILDGGHNNLSQIEQHSFPHSVEVIRLGWNQIRTVGTDTFSGLRNLRKVELNNNALTHLELKALRLSGGASTASQSSSSSSRALTEFFLAGNPFACDCDMEWLTRVNSLSSLRSHPFVVDMDLIQCHLHFSRFGPTLSLVEMKAQDFLCSYNSHCFALCHCCEFDACDCQMTCPPGCTCFHDDTWTANVVDCAGGNHSLIPSQLPMDSTEVYLDGNSMRELKSHGFIGRKNLRVLYLNSSGIELIANKSFNGLHSLQLLNLAENKLRVLHGYEFEQLSRLRELYLNDNLIRSISNNTFLPLKALEVLNLAGNRLVTYQVWQLNLNRNLMVIQMARNSWDCGCQFLQHLDKWTVENVGKISDTAELRCLWNRSGKIVPGPFVRDYNLTCLTTSTTSTTWPLIQQLFPTELEPLFPWLCAALLLLILIFSFVAIIRMSESVKYGIFWAFNGARVGNGPLCSYCCFGNDNNNGDGDGTNDNEKCVDAYFIYSEADQEFVTKRIVDELEDNGGYRVKLLYRDVENCTSQSMQMATIAATARALVLLLTPNFFHREWANLEFRQMILQCLTTDKSTSLPPAHKSKTQHQPHHHSASSSKRTILLLLKDDDPLKINSEFLKAFPAKVRRQLKKRTLHWTSKHFWCKLRFYLGEPRQRIAGQSDCTSTSYAYSSSRHLPGSSASSVYKPSTPSMSFRSPKPALKNDNFSEKLWPYASTLVPNGTPSTSAVPASALFQTQPEPPPHFQEILRQNNFNLNNYATYLSQMSQGSQRGRLYAGRASYGTVNCTYLPTKGQFSSSPMSSSGTTDSTTVESSEVSHASQCEGQPEQHQYIYCNGGADNDDDEVDEEPEHVYFSLEPSAITAAAAPALMSSPKLPYHHQEINRTVMETGHLKQGSFITCNGAQQYNRTGERKMQTFLV